MTVAAAAAVALAAAVPAAAQRVEQGAITSYIPGRIDPLIGFTPSHGVHPQGEPVRPITVRYAGRRYRFVYHGNAAVVWPTTSLILRTLARASGYSAGTYGAFVDRKLSARERRRVVQRADLGRDADVLVVASGHPACASGLTGAQARRIARGTIRRWSQVVAPAPGQPDAIAVWTAGSSTGAPVPTWGADEPGDYARGSRTATDAGLGRAAQGDLSVASLTSWSRARAYGGSVCAVPIDGTAPTDDTVRSLRYRAAYPILYVVSRAHSRASRESRAAMKGFVDWLRGPEAAEQFRARGMLLNADAG